MQHKKRQPINQLLQRAARNTKLRFVMVGVANTGIDFLLFNLIGHIFNADILVANIISTTVAMAFSYTMNKQAVFKSGQPHSIRQAALFLLVTLTSIWIIQNLIMVQVFGLLKSEFIAQHNSPLFVTFLENVAKVVGVAASAAWNYFGYSRIVFPQKGKK